MKARDRLTREKATLQSLLVAQYGPMLRKLLFTLTLLAVPGVPALAQTAGAEAPIEAGFQVCNNSFDVVNLAVAQPLPAGGFRTRGWWRVAPNQCATPLQEALGNRFIYAFATDIFGKAVLAGTVPMCIDPRRFTIDGAQDCLIRGHIEARFVEIDTRNAKSWTMYLAPRPD